MTSAKEPDMSRPSLSQRSLIAAALLCTVALPAAAQGRLDQIKADGVIQMGVALEPPYSVLEPDGTLTGADPDVLRAVFSELGEVDLKANVVDWGALIPGLLAGTVRLRCHRPLHPARALRGGAVLAARALRLRGLHRARGQPERHHDLR
jgi:ABC-type amino acid transport substrate-binding protein